MLLDHCREALAEAGDAETVAGLLTDLLARGDGAVLPADRLLPFRPSANDA